MTMDVARFKARQSAYQWRMPCWIPPIGSSFDHTVALKIARNGADIASVWSFHDGSDTLSPAGVFSRCARLALQSPDLAAGRNADKKFPKLRLDIRGETYTI